jgi:hypothetical protein
MDAGHRGVRYPAVAGGEGPATLLRARRRRVVGRSQMQVGLALTTATTAMWLAVFAIMALQGRIALAYSLARELSPGIVGLVNLCLCAGGLVCSRLRRSAAQQTVALRKAIAASSGVLMLIWMLLTLNAH